MTVSDSEVRTLGYGVILGSLFTFMPNRMNAIIIPFICIEIHKSPGLIGLFATTTGIGALLSTYTNKPVQIFQNSLIKLLVFSIVELLAGVLIVLSAYSASAFIFALFIAGYFTGSSEVGISTSRQELISELGSDKQTDTFMSIEEAASKVAILGGGSIAGLAIGLLGVAQASIVPVVLILVGVLVYLLLCVRQKSRIGYLRNNSEFEHEGSASRLFPLPEQPSMPQMFFIILRFVSSFMWFSFSLGFALYGSQKAEGSSGASLISIATVLYGAGTIVGAFISVYFSGRVKTIKRIIFGWLGSSSMFILLSMSIDNLIAVGLSSFIGGIFSPLGIAALNASIGTIKDRGKRSQHQMFLNWGLILSISAGSAFGGIILNSVGVRLSLLISGLSVLLPICAFLIVHIKRAEPR